MPKRFIEPNWKALREYSADLQRAWFYIWDKADEIGVYCYDADYFKLDLRLSEALSLPQIGTLPDCQILPGERVLIKNFIQVNYNILKPDYNPHKPAFRALQKNKLVLNSSLNQACFKLEEEDVYEEEDKDEEKGGMGEKWNTMPLSSIKLLLPVQNINSAIQLLKLTKQQEINDEQVLGMWNVFKVQNLTGKKYYQDEHAVFSHFQNWIKDQKFTNGQQSTHKGHGAFNGRNGGFQIAADALRASLSAGGTTGDPNEI